MGFEVCERVEDKSTNRRSVEQASVFPEGVVRSSPGQHQWAAGANIALIDLAVVPHELDDVVGPVALKANLHVQVTLSTQQQANSLLSTTGEGIYIHGVDAHLLCSEQGVSGPAS